MFLYSGNSNSGAVTTVARNRIDLSSPSWTSSILASDAKPAQTWLGRNVASRFRKSNKLRQDAPPLPIEPHKKICRTLLSAEILPHKFPLRPSQRSYHSAVPVDTHPQVSDSIIS